MTLWHLLAELALSDIAAIGYACEQRGRDLDCDELAVGVVHWPSGDSRCCTRHVERWHQIAEAMGITNLQVTPLPVKRALTFTDDASVRFSLLELA